MDWQQVVTKFGGEAVREQVIIEGRVVDKTETIDGKDVPVMLTVGQACINALITEWEDERQTGKQKFDRIILAMKINEDKPLTSEEVSQIKERVGRQYRADVVYNIWTALEAGK